MNRSVTISIALAIIAALWLASGALSSGDEDAIIENSLSTSTESSQTETAAFKVQVRDVSAVPMNELISLQGEIRPDRKIVIKAETHGSVAGISAKQGERLAEGQDIVALAINDRQARLEQARAELKVREADLASGLKLRQKNLISQNQHEQNVANVEAAKAAVKQIQVEIAHTRIQAAFPGILDEVHVEVGDYLSAGDPVATLVDDATVIIRAELPQQYLHKVSTGHIAEAELIDGTTLQGKINYISSSANPETRTFTIEASVDNTLGIQRFGQSARVRLVLEERLAHKLSPSYLDLDSKGGLRVKGVNADNRVQTFPVTILRNESDGVWLAGMPESLTLITVGQGFVSEGDTVEPVFENDEPSKQAETNGERAEGAIL